MLTDIAIRKLATPDSRREIPDGKVVGLYLVCQASGARSWALRFRIDGAPKKLTIGSYPPIDLASARRLAQKALGDIAEGKDPAAAKQASRAAARASREADEDRIERVVELFVERYAKPKTKDWRETAAMLNREVVGRWKGRRLSQITRADVHQMLDEIVDRGAPIAANRRFAALRKLCAWAVERGIIDRNPCDGVKAPSAETRRDRVLTNDELRLVWKACERVGLFGPLVRLLMLTGARRDEVAGMEWAELDLDARAWTLPAARTKNKREHVVPLSDAALEIIKGLPRVEGRRFLFSTTGRTHVSGFSKAKTEIDKAVLEIARQQAGDEAAPIPRWTFHDIRRSVATNLQKLGVRLEVTESCLNHTSGSRAGIVGIYQRHDWAEEKRTALQAWARKLEEIVSGKKADNVVELQARAS
jgi:integrase